MVIGLTSAYKVWFYFWLTPIAEVPSNYLSYSCSGHQVNLFLGCTSGLHFWVHFWFKSGHMPRTSPGLFNSGKLKLIFVKMLKLPILASFYLFSSFSRYNFNNSN